MDLIMDNFIWVVHQNMVGKFLMKCKSIGCDAEEIDDIEDDTEEYIKFKITGDIPAFLDTFESKSRKLINVIGESAIEFSPLLDKAISYEVRVQAQDLEDLSGVEEVIGDNLSGEAKKEWDVLLNKHGFKKLTKAVKSKYL